MTFEVIAMVLFAFALFDSLLIYSLVRGWLWTYPDVPLMASQLALFSGVLSGYLIGSLSNV